jgi:hypothetical protein
MKKNLSMSTLEFMVWIFIALLLADAITWLVKWISG